MTSEFHRKSQNPVITVGCVAFVSINMTVEHFEYCHSPASTVSLLRATFVAPEPGRRLPRARFRARLQSKGNCYVWSKRLFMIVCISLHLTRKHLHKVVDLPSANSVNTDPNTDYSSFFLFVWCLFLLHWFFIPIILLACFLVLISVVF